MKTETKLLIILGMTFILFIGSCTWAFGSFVDELSGCKGLQGVINQIWTGEKCADEDRQ